MNTFKESENTSSKAAILLFLSIIFLFVGSSLPIINPVTPRLNSDLMAFLGLGLSPPTPDWGLMVHDGLQSIRSQPWLILVPAGCIASLVVGINFATEGVVDAFGMEHARGVAGH